MATHKGKPPYGNYEGGHQAKQPQGKSIGNAPEFTKHKPHQSYASEQREHWGSKAEGKTMGSSKEVAFTGPHDRGSELEGKSNSDENAKQPSGKSIGAGRTDIAEHHKGHGMGGVAHSFKPPAANESHGYGHSITQRKGPLRMSGVAGAHCIGRKSK